MFHSSLIDQLTNASKTLREEIIEIMAAQGEPMSCADIMERSVLSSDRETLSREVFLMTKEEVLEKVGETKGPGLKTVWTYRLATAASGAPAAENDPITPDEKEEGRPSSTVKKEEVMQAEPSTQQPVTTQHIRDLVIAKPGILRDDVYKTLVFSDGSNKKKVGDLVSCLISTKQLAQTEEGGLKRLHPGPTIEATLARTRAKTPKTEAMQKAPAAKLLTGADARPFQQIKGLRGEYKPTANDDSATGNDITIPDFLRKTPMQASETALEHDSRFRCAWTSDNTLMLLGVNVLPIELTPEATGTLVKFIREERC